MDCHFLFQRAAALTGGFSTTEPPGKPWGRRCLVRTQPCTREIQRGFCSVHLGSSSVPAETRSVARRQALQAGSVVRGILWFFGMSVEDSELVTGSGGCTAYRDTVPIRKPEHSGLRAFWGRGRPRWHRCQDCASTAGAQVRSLVGELRYHRLHGAAKKKKRRRRGFRVKDLSLFPPSLPPARC